jgi:hypothetical protein
MCSKKGVGHSFSKHAAILNQQTHIPTGSNRSLSIANNRGEVVQSGLKFEIGRPAAWVEWLHRPAGRLGRVAESAGRPVGSSG